MTERNAGTTSADRRPIVVLLVDDQALVGAAVGRLLASEPDIQFHHCRDARRALAVANEIGPSVVLQDLVMPDLDGFSLIEALRRNPTTARIPILALSGNDDGPTRQRALDVGATDFIVKLPPKDDLISAIRRHVAGRAGPRAEPPPAVAAGATDDRIDASALAALRKLGADDFIRMLVDQFFDEARSRVDMLKSAIAGGDAPAVKVSAHSLKGSSRMVGAARLASVCVRIEQHLARQGLEGLERELTALDEELVRLPGAFEAEISPKTDR